MYGEAVTADVVSNLIGEELDKYIRGEKLDILGQPLPNNEKQQLIDFKNDTEFSFYQTVYLMLIRSYIVVSARFLILRVQSHYFSICFSISSKINFFKALTSLFIVPRIYWS